MRAVLVDPPKSTTRPRVSSYAMLVRARALGPALSTNVQRAPSNSHVSRASPAAVRPPNTTTRPRRESNVMAKSERAGGPGASSRVHRPSGPLPRIAQPLDRCIAPAKEDETRSTAVECETETATGGRPRGADGERAEEGGGRDVTSSPSHAAICALDARCNMLL
jgi:hypothetical protein